MYRLLGHDKLGVQWPGRKCDPKFSMKWWWHVRYLLIGLWCLLLRGLGIQDVSYFCQIQLDETFNILVPEASKAAVDSWKNTVDSAG